MSLGTTEIGVLEIGAAPSPYLAPAPGPSPAPAPEPAPEPERNYVFRPMTAQLITPLPTPPSRQDPGNFSARTDAFLAALKRLCEEINAATPGDSAAGLAQYLNQVDESGKGAALVAFLQAGASTSRSVQSKLRDFVSVRDFGATGDGGTNDTAAIVAANATGSQVTFPAGTYLIQSNVTFTRAPIFHSGAVLKVRGCVVTFAAGIEAGWHTIFDTTDVFTTSLIGDTSVHIRGCPVKADWFASKVRVIADIKTIPDQTNNLLKAFRAAAGNYVSRGAYFVNEYSDGVLQLGVGYYRVDGSITLGAIVSGTYYRLDGFKVAGLGAQASYLVRTNLASTEYVLFAAFYTGELTHISDFKITCYDPDSISPAGKFASAARALMFCQGDSLQINNIWVSGAQVGVTDSRGIKRNGVGIQFSSCVDTYFSDVFVEYCVTGVAFGSALVSGNNLTLFHTLNQAIGVGVFVADWPDVQTTSSRVNLTNIQANGNYNAGITALERGDNSEINIANSSFDGFDSELAAQGGTVFCDMAPNTTLRGSLSSSSVRNFIYRTFSIATGCSLGVYDHAYKISGVFVANVNATTQGGVIYTTGTGVFANLIVDGLSAADVAGVMLYGPQNGRVVMQNVTLSRYTGIADTSSNRQLFIGNGASIALRDWSRNTADTTALTQFGFASSGSVHIDIANLANATRLVSGSATVTMPSRVTFS